MVKERKKVKKEERKGLPISEWGNYFRGFFSPPLFKYIHNSVYGLNWELVQAEVRSVGGKSNPWPTNVWKKF